MSGYTGEGLMTLPSQAPLFHEEESMVIKPSCDDPLRVGTDGLMKMVAVFGYRQTAFTR